MNRMRTTKTTSIRGVKLTLPWSSRESVEGIINQYPEWNIRYIYNNNPGYGNCCLAKNIGIKQAKGDLIIFTEPEVLHLGDTIHQHLKWHKKQENIFISGGTVYFIFALVVQNFTIDNFENPKTILELQEIKEWKDGYQPQADDMAVLRKVSSVYCSSVMKKHLIDIGGFDERFLPHWGWDDIDCQSRLSKAGINCISDEKIKVIHLAHGYTGCCEVFEYNRKLHDDPNKPIITNQGKEWGVIKK